MTAPVTPDEPTTTAPDDAEAAALLAGPSGPLIAAAHDAAAASSLDGDDRRRELGRLIQFGAVGIVNTVITIAAFALMTALGVPGPLASALAFLAGAINSYVVNRRWTFSDLDQAPAAGARFLAIQCLGAALSAGGEALIQSAGASHIVAECAIVPCVTVALYGLARTYVFRAEDA